MPRLMNIDVPIEVMFKMLYKSYMQLQTQLGQEKAYNEELEERIRKYKLNIQKMKTESTETAREIKREAMYKRLKNQVTDLKRRIKAVQNMRNDAISQLNLFKKNNNDGSK